MRPINYTAPTRPSLRVVHGPELQHTLDQRSRDRTIKMLGSVIVGLSIALSYLWQWAEQAGLQ
jgi:hypothetical protein